jgi:hypothetical protein
MASSQADPTNPNASSDTSTSNNPAGKEKLSFGERHRAPTTKDVESNRWVFGAQQAVSRPGDHSADDAGTDLGGLGPAGDGGNLTAGTAAAGTGGASRLGVESGGRAQGVEGENMLAGQGEVEGVGGQERYLAERERMGAAAGEGEGGGEGYVRDERNLGEGEGPVGGGDGVVSGGQTGYEARRPVESTTAVYEGKAGNDTATGTGPRDDGVTGMEEDDGAGGKKKMNPLKKVVEAVKNI